MTGRSRRFDCADPAQRAEGINEAVAAVRMGQLIVLPTDTVYGVGADAFDRNAVTDLLLAKGRGRDIPPPVLVGSVRAGEALIDDLGHYGRDLIAEFWPGGLTLVCRATPTLNWDLGETKGTVAVRMPLHPVALEILKETGPLAVSGANLSGSPAATTADDAQEQLGGAISVYLDGGVCESPLGSTIVDLTGDIPRLLRAGVIPVAKIREICGLIEDPPPADETADDTADEIADETAEETAAETVAETAGVTGEEPAAETGEEGAGEPGEPAAAPAGSGAEDGPGDQPAG